MDAAEKSEKRLWLFGVLIAPTAMLSHGVVSGTLTMLLRQQGVGLAHSASIVSLLTLPFVINFLWSPITDFGLRRRNWIMVAAAIAAALLVAAFHMRNLASPAAIAMLFVSSCFGQLVLVSCGGMMGLLHSEAARRRAGSFYQAGSLALLTGVMVLGSRVWVPRRMLGLVQQRLRMAAAVQGGRRMGMGKEAMKADLSALRRSGPPPL